MVIALIAVLSVSAAVSVANVHDSYSVDLIVLQDGEGETYPAVGEYVVKSGKEITVTMEAAEGYRLDMVTVNGVVMPLQDGTMTFTADSDSVVHVFYITKEVQIPVASDHIFDGNIIYAFEDTEDYTVVGGSATDVGTYNAVFSLINPDYCHWPDGSTEDKTVEWTIQPRALLTTDFESLDDVVYTSYAIEPDVQCIGIMDGSYITSVQYVDNIDVGDAQVIIVAEGNIAGTVVLYFDILPKDISDAIITIDDTPIVYDGTEKRVDATVMLDGFIPTYTVSGDVGTDAGDYTYKIVGTGNFSGQVTKNWTIAPLSISDAVVTLCSEQVYNGSEQTVEVLTFTVGSINIPVDGYAAYGNTAIDVGEYVATFIGYGNFTGEVSETWAILPKDISDAVITIENPSVVYDGTQKHVSATVALDGYIPTYTVYGDVATDAGEYIYRIVGIGNFTGEVSETWVIAPLDISDAVVLAVSYYTYNGSEQTVSISSIYVDNIELMSEDYTITGDSATDAGDYQFTIFGTGNFIGEVSETWTIEPLHIVSAELTLGTEPVYNGSEQTVEVVSFTVDSMHLTSSDYTVTGNTGTDAGVYYAVFTGTGNFTGSIERSWNIVPLDISDAVVTLGENPVFNDDIQYVDVLSVVMDGIELGPDDFYYSGNSAKDVGTYPVEVLGIDNFTGIATAEWSIYGIKVGDAYYASLADAINDAVSGTITLVDGAIINEGEYLDLGNLATEYLLGNVSLDGKGFIIFDEGLEFGIFLSTVPSVTDIYFQGNSQSLIYVQNYPVPGTPTVFNDVVARADGGSGIYAEYARAGLVLNDCIVYQNGLADGYLAWFESALAVSNGSVVTIDGGQYLSTKYAVYSFGTSGNPSTVTINDGWFYGLLKVSGDDVIVINGGEFMGGLETSGNGTFVIRGGSFATDPSDYVSSGCAIVYRGGMYNVVPAIDIDGQGYSDLSEAIADAEEVIEIATGAVFDEDCCILPWEQYGSDLTAEYMLSGIGLTGDATIVLDEGLDFGMFLDGVPMIEGLTIQGDSQSLIYIQNSEVGGSHTTVRDLTVYADGGSGIYAEYAYNGVIIENCTVYQDGLGDGYKTWFEAAIAVSQGSVVTIKSGHYESSKYAIYAFGSGGSVIEVNGGTFIGELKVNPGDTLVINGGTFDHDPSAFLGFERTATDNGDGTWTVS